MLFFEHQDQARSRTSLLVFLFACAVFALGGISGLSTYLVLNLGREAGEPPQAWHLQMVVCAVIGTWGIIFLGSAYKMAALRAGGKSVAESLGGTLIAPNTKVLAERRALNLVEEMAIAAGMPTFPLYLLKNEPGINAFAAGWSADDAVIGLSQGALKELNRDQLQGVIAHELSHILNRDCALNMKLLGVLHGIVVISSIGRMVMSMTGSSRHSSTKREGGVIQIFIIGAVIWFFGSLGVFIARLIQAAVSQQREFLADASAVQFTRNPWGISGALAKIASASSVLHSPQAQDSSHMLISSPHASSLAGLLSSHPPLFERISRILPRWDGDFDSLAERKSAPLAEKRHTSDSEFELNSLTHTPLIELPGLDAQGQLGVLASASLLGEMSKNGQAAPLNHAAELIGSMDDRLHDAATDPFSCRALILVIVFGDQTQELAQSGGLTIDSAPLAHELNYLRAASASLKAHQKMPLFDVCLGTLASLSPHQQSQFAQLLVQLQARLPARAYQAYCLSTIALRHLRPGKSAAQPKALLIKSAIEITLGVLAEQGQIDDKEARLAFAQGIKLFSQRGAGLRFPSSDELNVRALDAALFTLGRLPVSTQKSLLNAAEAIASHDGHIHPSEAELLRVMALCLNLACPLVHHKVPEH